jgi:hypothetical protein
MNFEKYFCFDGDNIPDFDGNNSARLQRWQFNINFSCIFEFFYFKVTFL